MPLVRGEDQHGFPRGQGTFRKLPFEGFVRVVGQPIALQRGRFIRTVDDLYVIGIGPVGIREGQRVLGQDFTEEQGVGCPDPSGAVGGVALVGVGVSRRAVRRLGKARGGPDGRDVRLKRNSDGGILHIARGVLEGEGFAAGRFQTEVGVQGILAVPVAENHQVFIRFQGTGGQQPGRIAVGQRPAGEGYARAGGVMQLHPVAEKPVTVRIG